MRKNLDGGLLHAMHAFLKVIDSGSFTAAAEQMDLTTAQVSSYQRARNTLRYKINTTLNAPAGTDRYWCDLCRALSASYFNGG